MSSSPPEPAQAEAGEQLPPTPGTPPHSDERPRRDKAPKARSRRKRPASSSSGEPPLRGAARKAADARLENKLAEVLVFPAVPAVMFAPDPLTKMYLSEHFTRSGPVCAHELVQASENSPELRAILERVVTGSSMFTVAMALLAYAAPPVMWTLGMRQQAQQMTLASTMTPDDQEAMIAQARAAAESQAAEAAEAAANSGAEGAEGSPAEAGAAPLE